MKLQVNTSGAWKNVMEFEAPDVDINGRRTDDRRGSRRDSAAARQG